MIGGKLTATLSIILSFIRTSEVLAMSLETHTVDTIGKNISRVCIVNENGQRVLDTLIKPQFEDFSVKSGLKS